DPNALGRQVRLRRAAEGLVGMLQWLRLVGQANPAVESVNEFVAENYTVVVNILHSKSSVELIREKLRTVAKKVTKAATGVDLESPFFVYRFGHNKGQIVEWLDQPLGRLRDVEFADVPPDLRHQVVGRFRYRIDSFTKNV